MASIPPSGEQIEIALGDQHAVVVEVGGGLRAYSAGAATLLDGYEVDEMCPSGPRPGPDPVAEPAAGRQLRVRRTAASAPDRPASDEHNAIHGLVRWAAWKVAEREPHRVVMEHVLHPQPGYPFSLGLRHRVRPLGGGPARADDSHERWLGAVSLRERGASVPHRRHASASTRRFCARPADRAALGRARHPDRHGPPWRARAYDFRRPRAVGTTRLDHCFTDLERDGDGLARVQLAKSDGGSGVSLWVDESYPYLMLFTGDPLPDVDRRSLAVEPMTCPPNAFRTGKDLIRIEPGHSVTTTWGIGPCCSSG